MTNFNQLFPWIGLGASVVLSVLLLCTRVLQQNPSVSRIKDGTWLAWGASVSYLIHNAEEYGIDLMGNFYAFPKAMEALTAQAALLPAEFYTVLNVTMFWLIAPLVAYLSKNRKFLQIALAGVLLVNAIGHIGQLFIVGYTPGLLTCTILFLPISIWIYILHTKEYCITKKAIAMSVFLGILTHVLLIVPMFGFMAGIITSEVLIAIQIFNPILFLILSIYSERLI